MQRAKYANLLKDDDVRRWYENLSRGSRSLLTYASGGLGTFVSYEVLLKGSLPV